MNTQDVIKKVAIDHFRQHGYKGASLSGIANEVGIKKPSLYAHYDSKLSLFIDCMDFAMKEFLRAVEDILNDGNESGRTCLHNLLLNFTDEKDKSISFYLLFSYMPPEELGSDKLNYSNEFIQKMSQIISKPVERFISEIKIPAENSEIIKEAYLCMFDGLMVEFLFGDRESYSRRLEAMWYIFAEGAKSWRGH